MACQRMGRQGESHSERRGVIWSAERSQMGKERGRHRYGFQRLRKVGERERFEGKRIAAALGSRISVRVEIGRNSRRAEGVKRDTETQMK